jgi:sulfonate transport system substrate-binding protein
LKGNQQGNFMTSQRNHALSAQLSRRSLLKRTALLSLSLPLALQATACVPVTTAQPAGETAAEATASETATQPDQAAHLIRLIWSDGGIPFFAKHRGVFAEMLKAQNIEVEWVGPFAGHAPALQAVTGGSADLTFGGSSSVAMSAILGGTPFVFTASNLSTPRTNGIIAHPDSGIKSVADLVGKKVAGNRSGLGEFIFIAALEKYGIPRDQVEFLYLNPADAAPAFAQGQIDAWSIFGSNREIAEVEFGGIPIFIEGEELSLEEQIDTPSYMGLRDYVTENTDVIRAVLAGYQVEAKWATENEAESLALQAEVAGWSEALIEKYDSYDRTYEVVFIDDPLTARLQRGADWLLAHGILEDALVIADHVVQLG